MIPTRLNQQFNQGTVVGFSKTTGAVVVFANTIGYVDKFNSSSFERMQQESLAAYPTGYQWPTSDDFYHSMCRRIGRRLYEMDPLVKQNLIHRLCICSDKDYYLVTRECINNTKFVQVYMKFRGCTSLVSSGLYSKLTMGNLIPVMRINGHNCESF